MAIDFPSSPSTGQVFAPGTGILYQFDGTLWKAVGATGGGGGDFWASKTTTTTLGAAFAVIPFDQVVSGNLGGWYNPANGRYTPPAGRYHIFASYSGTGAAVTINMVIRKNGVANPNVGPSANTTTGSWYSEAYASGNYDANGTDYFEVWASANGVTAQVGGVWFGAFPIPASGTTSIPSSSWRQLGRVVPTAGQATVDFTGIPPDINSLMFEVANVVPQTNDVWLAIRCFDGTGTIDAGTNYQMAGATTSTAATTGGNASSTVATGATGILLTYNAANSFVNNTASAGGITVNGRMSGIRNLVRRYTTFQSFYLNGANTATVTVAGTGMWINATSIISGLRFVWSAGNFAAGGAVTLWGSP